MEASRRKTLLKPRTSARSGKTSFPSEHLEQTLFVSWFRQTFEGVIIFAIPNGGKRSKSEAARLKLEGVLPGVPDLCIPAWRLWIEFKRQKGGTVCKDQKLMKEYLSKNGYTVMICRGCEAAIEEIEKWRKEHE
jgi:hypothetical protein